MYTHPTLLQIYDPAIYTPGLRFSLLFLAGTIQDPSDIVALLSSRLMRVH